MNLNKEALEKPTKNEFVSAMTKAIKNAKEAYRRKRVVNPRRRPAEDVLEEEQPLRQRPRVLLPVNDDAPIVEAVQNEDIPPVRNNSNTQDNGEQEYDDDLQGSQNIEEDNDNPNQYIDEEYYDDNNSYESNGETQSVGEQSLDEDNLLFS